MQAAPPRPLWSDGENVRFSDLHAITSALLEHTSGKHFSECGHCRKTAMSMLSKLLRIFRNSGHVHDLNWASAELRTARSFRLIVDVSAVQTPNLAAAVPRVAAFQGSATNSFNRVSADGHALNASVAPKLLNLRLVSYGIYSNLTSPQIAQSGFGGRAPLMLPFPPPPYLLLTFYSHSAGST